MQEVNFMMDHKDKLFRESFLKETNEAVDHKEHVWHNIQQELFPKKKKSLWTGRIAMGFGTVAAAIIIVIISTSILTTERAGENGKSEQHEQLEQPEQPEKPSGDINVPLEDQYEKEIQMEREPEGQLEIVDMELAVHEADRYIIYVDKDRFEYKMDEDASFIQFTEAEGDMYPEVGITIRRYDDAEEQDLIERVNEEIEDEDMVIEEEENRSDPFDAYAITAYANESPDEWNSPVYRYYIYEADEEEGVYFVFKQMLFMEGVGGQSSLMDLMLETFEYVGE